MGLGQMFLSIASIALMGVLVLNMNASYLEVTDKALYHSDYTIDAISICESYVEIAIGKSYDEMNIMSYISKPKDFTKPSSLGPSYTETDVKTYDDFDDFNGYKDTVITDRGSYNISIEVVYVDIDKLDEASKKETWNKKMTVTVTSEFLEHPVSMEYIYSYF